MNYILELVDWLFILIAYCCTMLVYSAYLEATRKQLAIMLIFSLILDVISLVLSSYISALFIFIVGHLLIIMTVHLCFPKAKIGIKVLMALLPTSIEVITILISSMLMWLFRGGTPLEAPPTELSTFGISVMDTLLYCLIVIGIYLFKKRRTGQPVDGNFLCFPPIMFVQCIMIAIIIIQAKEAKVPYVLPLFIVLVLGGLLADVFLLYALIQNVKSKKIAMENLVMQELRKAQQSHLVEIQKRVEQDSILRHDFCNHIRTTKLLAMSNGGSAASYLDELEQSYIKQAAVTFCRIPVINAVLTEKASQAGESGMMLNVKLELPESLPYHETDLAVIFFSLLDNALEACASMHDAEARIIEIENETKGGYLFFYFTNPCPKQPNFKAGIPQTTKPHEDLHGLGCKSIMMITQKYGGNATFRWEQGEFIASIMLPI